ncbi:hypothetical protein BT96DRAFT_776143, partial [Gymnopus androsaceus JB14]
KQSKGKKKLAKLKLLNKEWELMEELKPMLKNFQHVTKQLSELGCPLIADVIPVIDTLHDRLDALLNDFTKETIIRPSAAKASTIIDKYYAKMDDSKMY